MSATSKRNRQEAEAKAAEWKPSDGAYDKRYDKKAMGEKKQAREEVQAMLDLTMGKM